MPVPKRAASIDKAIRILPADSKWDYSIDLRLHLKAGSLEEAIRKTQKLCNTVTNRLPWGWLVIKSWKD